VRIVGTGVERFAVVCFKKAEDAEKALLASHDKRFFGVKIQVRNSQYSFNQMTN
jgi:RNA recognition motif-containing protein